MRDTPSPATVASLKLMRTPSGYGVSIGKPGLLCPKPNRDSFTANAPNRWVSARVACRGWFVDDAPKPGRFVSMKVSPVEFCTESNTLYRAHSISLFPKFASPRTDHWYESVFAGAAVGICPL